MSQQHEQVARHHETEQEHVRLMLIPLLMVLTLLVPHYHVWHEHASTT